MPWPWILSLLWIPVVVWFYIWLRVVSRTVLREREILHGACTRLARLNSSTHSRVNELRSDYESYVCGHACDTDEWWFQNSQRLNRIEDALGLERWDPVAARRDDPFNCDCCHHGIALDQECQHCLQEE